MTDNANIIIRADASIELGTGHVMRCLTLAEQLHAYGMNISFIARTLPGDLCDLIESKGYVTYRLQHSGDRPMASRETLEVDVLGVSPEKDVEEMKTIIEQMKKPLSWLIVDHYLLDERWEQRLRPFVKKIMVIDDLADRRHMCDILLDQNLYHDMTTRYDKLVPAECKRFLGPRYALLRPEFRNARRTLRHRNGAVQRILIFFGGSDPTNETEKALKAVSMLNRPEIALDVIVGSSNPHSDKIQTLCRATPNTIFHRQVTNMAQLMADADLAIGAGGTATWERCFLGLPSVTIVIADKQAGIADAVAAEGATVNLRRHDHVSAAVLAETLTRLITNPDLLSEMSKRAFTIMAAEGREGSDHPLVRVLMERFPC